MVEISKEAQALNEILEREAPHIHGLLSASGLKAYFPKRGILAQTTEAAGSKTNATIGIALEDDGTPMVLRSLSNQFTRSDEQTFIYSPSYGQRQLRELWRDSIIKKNPSLPVVTTLPVVVNGLTHGLYIAGRLFVNQGDHIITPDKLWENYLLTFEQAEFDEFPLFSGSGFNLPGLEDRLNGTGQKKVLLLNFPNNPSGYTPTEQEAEDIVSIIKRSAERGNQIAVVVDDAYFGLVFEDGIYKESMFAKLVDLDERVLAVKVDGISKELYSWGLRVAFVTYGFKGMTDQVASALEEKTAGVVRGTISNVSTFPQFVAIDGLQSPNFSLEVEKNYEGLRERYYAVKQTLEANPHYREVFEPLPHNSGYFMCVQLKDPIAEQVRLALLRQDESVGLIAQGNLLRIAFSSVGKDKIAELFESIYQTSKFSSDV